MSYTEIVDNDDLEDIRGFDSIAYNDLIDKLSVYET